MMYLSMDLIREIWIKRSLLREHEAKKVQLTWYKTDRMGSGFHSKKSVHCFTAASFTM